MIPFLHVLHEVAGFVMHCYLATGFNFFRDLSDYCSGKASSQYCYSVISAV